MKTGKKSLCYVRLSWPNLSIRKKGILSLSSDFGPDDGSDLILSLLRIIT